MTDERLAELTALCEIFNKYNAYYDVELIAAARQALPELIGEIKHLKAGLENICESCTQFDAAIQAGEECDKYKTLFAAEQAEHLKTSEKVEALERALRDACTYDKNLCEYCGHVSLELCGKCRDGKYFNFDCEKFYGDENGK